MKKTTDTPADEEFAALCGRVWDIPVPARAGYPAGVSPHYNEVFHDIAQRTEHTGSLGTTDIAALAIWKRLSTQTRRATELMPLPDTHIRAVTERVVTAVRDHTVPRSEAARTGRGITWEQPGLRTGDTLASALLTATTPHRMAVHNRHAQHTLDTPTPTPGRHGRYLHLLDNLLHHGAAPADDWTAHDNDTALYQTGTPTHPPTTTQRHNDTPRSKPLTNTNPRQPSRYQRPPPTPHHRYPPTTNNPKPNTPPTTTKHPPKAPTLLSQNPQHPSPHPTHHINHQPRNHTPGGPIVCGGVLDLSRAVLSCPIRIRIAAAQVLLEAAQIDTALTLDVRYADINLLDAVLSQPVAINFHPRPFPFNDTLVPEDPLTGQDPQPSVAMLAGVDVAFLAVSGVDLTACPFTGAHHLDQLTVPSRSERVSGCRGPLRCAARVGGGQHRESNKWRPRELKCRSFGAGL